MDARKVFVVLFLTISAGLAQESYKYLGELKLSLREERIPAIVNYLLNNSLEVHDIKTQDIIQLSKLDQYDYDRIVQVFKYFNISEVEAFNVDTLENLLDTIGLQFSEFFRDVTSKLQLTTEQTEQIIRDLSVPETFWVGISLNNKDRIFSALREGIYDQQHVDAALQTAGKTRNEVYNAARDIVLLKILELNSTTFMGILKEKGWDRKFALTMYEALNITTADVYKVEKFRNIFDNIVNDLNANTSLGVFVGPNQLAVHDSVYRNLLQKVDGVTVKVEANGLEVTLRKNSSFGEKIVELVTVQTGADYIGMVENYTAFDNCTYVTVRNGSVSAKRVVVDGSGIRKNDSTVFILGSPLICDGLLYGLAGNETDTHIIFDVFYTEDSPPPATDAPEPDDVTGSSPGLSLFSGLTFALITLALCVH